MCPNLLFELVTARSCTLWPSHRVNVYYVGGYLATGLDAEGAENMWFRVQEIESE